MAWEAIPVWRRAGGDLATLHRAAQRTCECDFQVTSELFGLFYDSNHHDRKRRTTGGWPDQLKNWEPPRPSGRLFLRLWFICRWGLCQFRL